ncbi:MAG: hypothetical protein KGY81_03095, partial [Phycisphaerae bacterium]|nr:hypothetical protein [Phycisphaerae bacterium]
MSRIFRAVSPVLATVCFLGATQAEPPTDDPAMGRALQHVEQSDRYLHHSRLKRGMKGYGLTVFAGTTVETFDVEIVSVVQNFDIGQDVILARASGHGLDESMIAQGMSGSPVFVKDPRDGKDKMIGAIAYGWPFSKEPLAGIQPITQMLAIAGVLDEQGKGQRAESGGTGIGGGDHGFAETVLAVELDRKQMRTFGITDAQVRSLLPTEKRSSLDGDVIRLTVVDAAEVSEIQNLKIMERNGAVVHLGDVSRVRLLGAWEGVSDLEKQKQSDGRGAPAGASRIARDRRAFLRVVLSPNRQGLNKLYEPIRTTLTARDGRSLAPLATPLSISAARPAMLAWIRKRLAPAGLAPVQGG